MKLPRIQILLPSFVTTRFRFIRLLSFAYDHSTGSCKLILFLCCCAGQKYQQHLQHQQHLPTTPTMSTTLASFSAKTSSRPRSLLVFRKIIAKNCVWHHYLSRPNIPGILSWVAWYTIFFFSNMNSWICPSGDTKVEVQMHYCQNIAKTKPIYFLATHFVYFWCLCSQWKIQVRILKEAII